MKLWLDDKRLPLAGYDLWIKTSKEFIDALVKYEGQVEEISLDHDLGSKDVTGEGYDVILWLEEQAHSDTYPPLKIIVHTSNTPARNRMLAGAENAYRYWGYGYYLKPVWIDYEKVKDIGGLDGKWINLDIPEQTLR